LTNQIIFDIIVSLINRRPDINILIVLNQYSDKNNIIDAFNLDEDSRNENDNEIENFKGEYNNNLMNNN